MRHFSAWPRRIPAQQSERPGSPVKPRRLPWAEPWWPVLIFCLGLAHAGAFALLTPPWQAPDEPGHMEYACLLGRLGRPPQVADRTPELQAEIIANLARNDFWTAVRQPPPAPLPPVFAADPFLAKSGRQVGDEPPLYYLLPAQICRLNWPLEARLRLVRLMGAVLFGFTGVVAVWAWRVHWVAAAQWTPLVVVLLPMPAFISGSANNDALALLTATAVFAAVLRIQRLGFTWPRAAGAVALLGLALVSKKTNAFLLPWTIMLAAVGAWRWLGHALSGRSLWSRPWTRLGLALALPAALLALLLLPSRAPAAWRERSQPMGQGQGLVNEDDRPVVARVVDQPLPSEGRIFQSVTGAVVAAAHGAPVQASVWVRSGDSRPQAGRLTVRDAAAYDEIHFMADDRWQWVAISHTVAMTTSYVKLAVTAVRTDPAQAGALLVDDAFLGRPGGDNWLRNAGFQRSARWGELMIVAPLEERWQEFAPRVFSPVAFSFEAVRRYALFTALLFPSFWGNFGWLQRPAPIGVYAVWAVLCLAAAAGLIRMGRGPRPAAVRPAIVASWALALFLLALQTLLPMVGRQWQPQGRYLFPALLPLVSLLVLGLDAWLQTDRYPRRFLVILTMFLLFDAYSLARASFLL